MPTNPVMSTAPNVDELRLAANGSLVTAVVDLSVLAMSLWATDRVAAQKVMDLSDRCSVILTEVVRMAEHR